MINYFLLTIPEEDMGFLKRLWLYFYEYYLNPDKSEEISSGAVSLVSVRMIAIGLFVGFAVAGFAAVFNKRVLGALVRRLISEECFSRDSAKTLDELGFDTVFMRLAVKHSTSLRRVVKCREEEEFYESQQQKQGEYEQQREENKKLPRFKETQYKINDLTDAFYIPEQMKYTADVKFEKKGNSWFSTIVCTLALLLMLVVVLLVLPYVVEVFDSITESFRTTPKGRR